MRIKDEAPHQNPTSTDRYESREEQVESDGNFYDDDSESIFFRAVSLGVALSRDSYDTFNAQTEAELKENYHAQSNTVVDDNARMELGEGATSVQDGHETFGEDDLQRKEKQVDEILKDSDFDQGQLHYG
jgi:hypothetical protein